MMQLIMKHFFSSRASMMFLSALLWPPHEKKQINVFISLVFPFPSNPRGSSFVTGQWGAHTATSPSPDPGIWTKTPSRSVRVQLSVRRTPAEREAIAIPTDLKTAAADSEHLRTQRRSECQRAACKYQHSLPEFLAPFTRHAMDSGRRNSSCRAHGTQANVGRWLHVLFLNKKQHRKGLWRQRRTFKIWNCAFASRYWHWNGILQ